ncbi:hypothetical protein FCV25MIE_19337 [Fagus crenata]
MPTRGVDVFDACPRGIRLFISGIHGLVRSVHDLRMVTYAVAVSVHFIFAPFEILLPSLQISKNLCHSSSSSPRSCLMLPDLMVLDPVLLLQLRLQCRTCLPWMRSLVPKYGCPNLLKGKRSLPFSAKGTHICCSAPQYGKPFDSNSHFVACCLT